MKVELIAMTQPINGGTDMDVIEEAASVCYDSEPTKEHRIVKACMKSGHRSVFEHASYTFHISDVSRSLLAQITRHRHASFSVRSQRYCREDGFDYIVPEDISKDESSLTFFLNDIEFTRLVYGDLVNKYNQAPEDARAILPNACCTEFYITVNARTLVEMSWLRMCERAQDEIRNLFKMIKQELSKYSPEIASYMVPQCYAHSTMPFCTEHNSCGLAPKLKDVYAAYKEKENNNEQS